MAKQANQKPAEGTSPATPPVTNQPATPPVTETTPPATADQGTPPVTETTPPASETQPVALPQAEITDVIEMEVHRVADEPDGGDYLFLRAVVHPNASGVLKNLAWGGPSPRGFMEIVIKGGSLMGQLRAGSRVALTLTITE